MEMKVPAQSILREKEDNILEIIPFNSGRKRATTAVRLPSDQNVVRVFCKGAPEIVIEYCDSTFNKEGKVVEFSSKDKKALMEDVVTKNFARKAYRCLLIAY